MKYLRRQNQMLRARNYLFLGVFPAKRICHSFMNVYCFFCCQYFVDEDWTSGMNNRSSISVLVKSLQTILIFSASSLSVDKVSHGVNVASVFFQSSWIDVNFKKSKRLQSFGPSHQFSSICRHRRYTFHLKLLCRGFLLGHLFPDVLRKCELNRL